MGLTRSDIMGVLLWWLGGSRGYIAG